MKKYRANCHMRLTTAVKSIGFPTKNAMNEAFPLNKTPPKKKAAWKWTPGIGDSYPSYPSGTYRQGWQPGAGWWDADHAKQCTGGVAKLVLWRVAVFSVKKFQNWLQVEVASWFLGNVCFFQGFFLEESCSWLLGCCMVMGLHEWLFGGIHT